MKEYISYCGLNCETCNMSDQAVRYAKTGGNLRQLPGNEFLSESRGYSYQQS